MDDAASANPANGYSSQPPEARPVNSKRKIIFIKKDIQGRLILGYFLFVAAGCFLFIVMFAAVAAEPLLGISADRHSSQINQTPLFLLKNTLTGHWLLFALGALLLGFAAIRITHRVAGPLFNVEQTVEQMLRRNLSRDICLRDTDQGQELAVKINTFNRDLSKTLRAISQHAEASTVLLEQARTMRHDSSDCDALNSLLWAVEDKNKKINRLCRSYALHQE